MQTTLSPRDLTPGTDGSSAATTAASVSAVASSSSARLLARLARSPTSSRKHKTSSSINNSALDSTADEVPAIPTIPPSQGRHPRPSLARNVSTPTLPATAPSQQNNTSLSRTASDGKRGTYVPEHGSMLDVAMTAGALKPPGSSAGRPNTADAREGLLLPPSATVPTFQFQQLHDIATKRIATLEYIRTTHEGQRYWFNTVQFSKTDISRLPSYHANRLSRRAIKYLLLGLSVPAVLDVHPPPNPSNAPAANALVALELLRSLNTLLTEFESYVQLHPSDGSYVSSLSRARLPQMFKRATTTSRPRKSSGATDFSQASQISPPAIPDSHMSMDSAYSTSTFASSTATLANSATSVPLSGGGTSSYPPPGPADAPNATVLPNEGPYTHLLTPPIPFTPDFYAVFATLCDVLVDTYHRITQTVNTPNACTGPVAESFSKADARIRKIMVGGMIRDFESTARESAKRELMGVQKVVLSGLMGV